MWCSECWSGSCPCSDFECVSAISLIPRRCLPAARMTRGTFSLVPADQIEQREEEDPDNIDKVPVQTKVLNEGDVAVHVSTTHRFGEHAAKQHDTDDHVNGVHAGHGKVEREVNLGPLRHVYWKRFVIRFLGGFVRLRMREGLNTEAAAGNVMLFPLLVVLDRLDTQ